MSKKPDPLPSIVIECEEKEIVYHSPTTSTTNDNSRSGSLENLNLPKDDRSNQSRASFSQGAKNFTKRASQLIIQSPVEQLKKIAHVKPMSSLSKETQHFVELNKTGEFSNILLNYLTLTFLEIQQILSIYSDKDLKKGHDEMKRYKKEVDSNFSIKSFHTNAGFSCADLLKICSFGGREFNCCQIATPVLTDMGMCYRIQLENSPYSWMRKQKQAGIDNGLQVIADTHMEEELNVTSIYEDAVYSGQPIFANQLENGFRFFVHIARDLPHLASEGISVSSGKIVYTAIAPTKYILLPDDSWGNCTKKWPKTVPINDGSEYSSIRCVAFCRAQYFIKKCGCSPFIYDIGGKFKMCNALEIYVCLREESNATELDPEVALLEIPPCDECKIECEKWQYHTYNSYSDTYSRGALAWFSNRNSTWNTSYVRTNFVTINVFYRELTYALFQQSQSITITTLLSNIGGNMGMFLGMSLLSIIEVLMYFYKLVWIFISRSRRNYMTQKNEEEKEKERRLEETLQEINPIRTPTVENNENRKAFVNDWVNQRLYGFGAATKQPPEHDTNEPTSTTQQLIFNFNEDVIKQHTDMAKRSRAYTTNSEYPHSNRPEFTIGSKALNYYNVLLEIVKPLLYKNGGPILTVQVENEYGYAPACNHTYTAWLRDLLLSKLGNDTVLTTVDGAYYPQALECGTVPGVLATVDFGTESNDAIDKYFTQQHKYNNGGPTICTEYWVGSFSTEWGQPLGYLPYAPLVADNMDHMYYKWNASFNFYMIHGGTNFGFMNGAYDSPIATSYDHGCAIAENGDTTLVYTTVRSFIQNISDWSQPPLSIPANNPATNYSQVTLQRIGTNLISTLTQIQEACHQAQYPKNFEEIDHGYGYVLYTTTLAKGGKMLSSKLIKDYGFVFVNNIYQNQNGAILGYNNVTSIPINAQAGDVLRILVENRGRRVDGQNTDYNHK
uniref:Glycoside hydrolase 35 catalytic domain-containing protein n=1 Tax=Acrobeloides nanus TaxID=290746 RepID=A0A914DFG0_9BILA